MNNKFEKENNNFKLLEENNNFNILENWIELQKIIKEQNIMNNNFSHLNKKNIEKIKE